VQEAALQEFAVLESQVLQAVGNTPLPHRPSPLGSKTHAAAAARGIGVYATSGSTHVGQPAAAAKEQQWGDPVDIVLQNDGEGWPPAAAGHGSCAQAAVTGTAHAPSRRALQSGGVDEGAAAPTSPAHGGRGGEVQEEELEMEAEVGKAGW
jgi:hypothetical protein